MVVRSLQARIFRHLIGVPCIDFSSLVMALCNVDDDFSRELWLDSSFTDSKGKNTSGEQRTDVNIISSIKQRAFKHHQLVPHTTRAYSPYHRYQYKQLVPPQSFDWTYSYPTLPQTCYAIQFTRRPSTSFPRAKPPQTRTSFALNISRCLSQLRIPLS